METINTKSVLVNRIFYSILILLIIGSVGFTFWRIVIQKDYQIVAEVSCDIATESCFNYEGVVCDDTTDIECIAEEPYNYKIISKKAATIYTCEQTEEKLGCSEELSCLEGEADCEYTNCDPEADEVCAEVPPSELVEEEIIPEPTDEITEE
jgi:hypothetical protein